MFGEGLITVPMWEQAYQYLRTNTNFLKLNTKEVERQRQRDAKQRFDVETARFNNDAWAHSFDELSVAAQKELESLPIEELRRRATIAEQERMRRIGEEGGW
jgi:hypothetical protein